MSRLRPACVVGVVLLTSACRDQPPDYLDIATTTSVKDSGLVADLAPAFQKETAIVIRTHATTSGRALQMLADEVVDVALTHAPRLEAKYLDSRPDCSGVPSGRSRVDSRVEMAMTVFSLRV